MCRKWYGSSNYRCGGARSAYFYVSGKKPLRASYLALVLCQACNWPVRHSLPGERVLVVFESLRFPKYGGRGSSIRPPVEDSSHRRQFVQQEEATWEVFARCRFVRHYHFR